jgi:hypothetical protein
MIYFAKSTNTFYDSDVHESGQIPKDAVEITAEKHQEILLAHYAGAAISADDKGHPINVARVETADQKQERVLAEAKHALKESDIVVLRCYEENAPVPAEWVAYRKQLRDVVAGKATDLPQAPEAP